MLVSLGLCALMADHLEGLADEAYDQGEQG